jgi:hypothetical protein
MNDVKSNVEMLLLEELELLESRLKFRGPWTGDSEVEIEEARGWIDEVREGLMVSVSKKDGLSETEELSRSSFWR